MLPSEDSFISPFVPLLQVCNPSFCVPLPFIGYNINIFCVFIIHIVTEVDITTIFFPKQIYL